MSHPPVRLTSAAEKDLREANRWYQSEAPHVVPRFRRKVAEALQRIGDNPYLYAIVQSEVRHALVHGFRYRILFRIRPDSIQVIAILHEARNPELWNQRS